LHWYHRPNDAASSSLLVQITPTFPSNVEIQISRNHLWWIDYWSLLPYQWNDCVCNYHKSCSIGNWSEHHNIWGSIDFSMTCVCIEIMDRMMRCPIPCSFRHRPFSHGSPAANLSKSFAIKWFILFLTRRRSPLLDSDRKVHLWCFSFWNCFRNETLGLEEVCPVMLNEGKWIALVRLFWTCFEEVQGFDSKWRLLVRILTIYCMFDWVSQRDLVTAIWYRSGWSACEAICRKETKISRKERKRWLKTWGWMKSWLLDWLEAFGDFDVNLSHCFAQILHTLGRYVWDRFAELEEEIADLCDWLNRRFCKCAFRSCRVFSQRFPTKCSSRFPVDNKWSE
jgi:hypothetical protein